MTPIFSLHILLSYLIVNAYVININNNLPCKTADSLQSHRFTPVSSSCVENTNQSFAVDLNSKSLMIRN